MAEGQINGYKSRWFSHRKISSARKSTFASQSPIHSRPRTRFSTPLVRQEKGLPGQLYLNDDASTQDQGELSDVMSAMTELYKGFFPGEEPV
jgi:hypothetical protein